MIPSRESSTVEFKAEYTNTCLKTVSAFANYGTGHIFFGVSDTGQIVGVHDPQELALRIEQKINGTLEPRPQYRIDLLDGNVLSLTVMEGFDKPYQYQGKAYRRGDSSTVQVDRAELQNLFLQGANRSFDELPIRQTELTFTQLADAFCAQKDIETFTIDTLKTLGLYSTSEGYNHAALIFSDQNTCPGIDIVRFGRNPDEFDGQLHLDKASIIQQFQQALDYFQQFYVYEKIEQFTRKTRERIPQEAFREALANALAHRDWSLNARIQISMFSDRIEITSPGGLPKGMSEQAYLDRYYALPRNPLVANVLHLLGYIEGLGTGISRIRRSYAGVAQVPTFSVQETLIHITLPVITDLPPTQQLVLDCMGNEPVSRQEIEHATKMTKTKVVRLLGELETKGIVKRVGAGPATRYQKQR